MRLDLRLLRYAQALATHRSFSRAAEALHLAQPTLSRGIQDLESRVGVPLFNRSPSGVEPTDFGLVFLTRAAEVTGQMDDLEREVALAKGLQTGEIVVGMGPYAAEVLFARAVARLAAAHPAPRVRLVVGGWEFLLAQLRARACEFVVAEATVIAQEDDVETVRRLGALRGYVVARSGHPLTRLPAARIEDVFAYPYVQVVRLPPRILGPILKALAGNDRADGSASPSFPAIECPTVPLAVQVVCRTDAVTFATLDAVEGDLRGDRLVPLLHEPWMRTEWGVMRLRRRTLSPAGFAFAAAIQEAHDEAQRTGAALERRCTPSKASRPSSMSRKVRKAREP